MGRDWISRTHMPGALQWVITVFVSEAFANLKNCHLPSASTRIRSQAAAAADLEHTLKGVQGGDLECGPLCSGKNWQNRPSDS